MINSPIRCFFICWTIILALSASASANAPSGRYIISNGTVYDTKTKLTWQQTVPTSPYTWLNAENYCSATLGSPWRLPTVSELLSIVDYSINHHGTGAALIDPSAFPGTLVYYFWASTLLSATTTYHWYVDFTDEFPYTFFTNDSAVSYAVRCVH
jgi:hypothetical protein